MKAYLLVSGTIFALFFLMHVYIAIQDWQVPAAGVWNGLGLCSSVFPPSSWPSGRSGFSGRPPAEMTARRFAILVYAVLGTLAVAGGILALLNPSIAVPPGAASP